MDFAHPAARSAGAEVGPRARRLDPRPLHLIADPRRRALVERALGALRGRGRAGAAAPAPERRSTATPTTTTSSSATRARRPRRGQPHRLRRHAPRAHRRRGGDRRGLRDPRRSRIPWPRRRTSCAGTTRAFPLDEAEIALLLPADRRAARGERHELGADADAEPDDPYVTISEAPAWEALERLARRFIRASPITRSARPADSAPVPHAARVDGLAAPTPATPPRCWRVRPPDGAVPGVRPERGQPRSSAPIPRPPRRAR